MSDTLLILKSNLTIQPAQSMTNLSLQCQFINFPLHFELVKNQIAIFEFAQI